MHLTHYDETGADGHPETSSLLLVLTALYLHDRPWQEALDCFRQFRKHQWVVRTAGELVV